MVVRLGAGLHERLGHMHGDHGREIQALATCEAKLAVDMGAAGRPLVLRIDDQDAWC